MYQIALSIDPFEKQEFSGSIDAFGDLELTEIPRIGEKLALADTSRSILTVYRVDDVVRLLEIEENEHEDSEFSNKEDLSIVYLQVSPLFVRPIKVD